MSFSHNLNSLKFSEKLSETETNKLKKLVAELKLRGDQNNSTEMLADDLSDLSEDDDNLYPDGENEEAEGLKLIQLELKPTTNPKIKQLFFRY
ncbi:hypothetical protein EB796_017805 [Bugula neritina]|uniref:Uncharacterized protein n=1 Tax=Bugula neritina TaxID=10212 RepID=A0A7J7JE44_BUGNE|nr:hypothetical protein EB796_017805 [Bugula neritina]